jgi:hypothetical protein
MDGGPAEPEEGIILLEGWMIGVLYFPLAMQEVERVPPANDLTD